MAKGSHATWDGFHQERRCALCHQKLSMKRESLWINTHRQLAAHTSCVSANPAAWWAA